ncbi:MAG: hypothetical protein ACREJD_08975 [Phycisphaerales bacterium]
MGYLLVFAWVGGLGVWATAIALFVGLRAERRDQSAEKNCACCGYSLRDLSGSLRCPECGADEIAQAEERDDRDGAGKLIAIVAACLILLENGVVGAVFFGQSDLVGAFFAIPVAAFVWFALWLQSNVIEVGSCAITAVLLLVTYFGLYGLMVSSFSGTTDPIGPGLTIMFSSILIGPFLGYCFLPCIIWTRRRP